MASGQWRGLRDEQERVRKEVQFVDKYRIEMLHDAKRVEQEIESQMNYDKFQFERQRKKMNALMKSEKEGVLKERSMMEEERRAIEAKKVEWNEKLLSLEKQEAEFDEKVVLARSNMNEVVFQKGLTELLKEHRAEMAHELREQVDADRLFSVDALNWFQPGF